jgi:molybdenum cofactor biosynthesis enzyme MoaA
MTDSILSRFAPQFLKNFHKKQQKMYYDDILAQVMRSIKEPVSFCDHIGDTLVFYPGLGLLSHCCAFYTTKAAPFICEYAGGEFPLESYLRSRRDYILRNITHTGTCKGCHHIEEGWPALIFVNFKRITVSCKNICQLKCRYCHLGEETRDHYSLLPVFKDLRSIGLMTRNTVVSWTGGEPTLSEHFDEAVKFLVNSGIEQGFLSNAILFSDLIASALKVGDTKLMVSIDSGTPERYRDIKGGDYYETVWENVRRYNFDGNRNVCAKYIVCQDNMNDEELIGFVGKSVWAGLKKIIISVDFTTYDPIHNKELSMQYVNTAKRLRAIAEQKGLSVETIIFRKEDELSIISCEKDELLPKYSVNAQLFFHIDEQYSEIHSLQRKSVAIMGDRYKVEFGIPASLPAMRQVRLDPADEPITFIPAEAVVVDTNGSTHDIKFLYANGETYGEGYIFRHNDPMLIFDTSEIDFSAAYYISFSGIIGKIPDDENCD